MGGSARFGPLTRQRYKRQCAERSFVCHSLESCSHSSVDGAAPFFAVPRPQEGAIWREATSLAHDSACLGLGDGSPANIHDVSGYGSDMMARHYPGQSRAIHAANMRAKLGPLQVSARRGTRTPGQRLRGLLASAAARARLASSPSPTSRRSTALAVCRTFPHPLSLEECGGLARRQRMFSLPTWAMLVPPAGLEPATPRLEAECSIR